MAGGQCHALVVEDDAACACAMEKALTLAGIRVTVAGDGFSALKSQDDDPADMVMLDLRLPDMRGSAVALDLHSRYPDLPIVVITGYSGLELDVDFKVAAVLAK